MRRLRMTLLRASLARWRSVPQRPKAVAALLLERGAAAAPTLATAAALRRLLCLSCARACRLRHAATARRLVLRLHWRQLLFNTASAHQYVQRVAIALDRARRLSLRRAAGRWVALVNTARRMQSEAIHAAALGQARGCALAWRCWRRWLGWRAAWRRRSNRRASSNGGWSALHHPWLSRQYARE